MAKAKQADGEDTLVGWLVGVDTLVGWLVGVGLAGGSHIAWWHSRGQPQVVWRQLRTAVLGGESVTKSRFVGFVASVYCGPGLELSQ